MIIHSTIYQNKIKLLRLYSVNQLIQNSKASIISTYIHTKMKMYMIREFQMMDQTQKIYRIK
jgi:hypothetical protein